jgi:hypothetical protein
MAGFSGAPKQNIVQKIGSGISGAVDTAKKFVQGTSQYNAPTGGTGPSQAVNQKITNVSAESKVYDGSRTDFGGGGGESRSTMTVGGGSSNIGGGSTSNNGNSSSGYKGPIIGSGSGSKPNKNTSNNNGQNSQTNNISGSSTITNTRTATTNFGNVSANTQKLIDKYPGGFVTFGSSVAPTGYNPNKGYEGSSTIQYNNKTGKYDVTTTYDKLGGLSKTDVAPITYSLTEQELKSSDPQTYNKITVMDSQLPMEGSENKKSSIYTELGGYSELGYSRMGTPLSEAGFGNIPGMKEKGNKALQQVLSPNMSLRGVINMQTQQKVANLLYGKGQSIMMEEKPILNNKKGLGIQPTSITDTKSRNLFIEPLKNRYVNISNKDKIKSNMYSGVEDNKNWVGTNFSSKLSKLSSNLEYGVQTKSVRNSKDVLIKEGSAAASFGIGIIGGGLSVVEHPVQTVKGVVNSILHPIESGKMIINELKYNPIKTSGEIIGQTYVLGVAGKALPKIETATTYKLKNITPKWSDVIPIGVKTGPLKYESGVIKTNVGDYSYKTIGLDISNRGASGGMPFYTIINYKMPKNINMQKKIPFFKVFGDTLKSKTGNTESIVELKTIKENYAQPVSAIGAKITDKILGYTPEKFTFLKKSDIAVRKKAYTGITNRRGLFEKGFLITDSTIHIKGIKNPKKASELVEQFAIENEGVYYGTSTEASIGGLKTYRPGDIDLHLAKGGKEIIPRIAELAEKLKKSGENVQIRKSDPTTIEFADTLKNFLEVKLGKEPGLFGGEIAPEGVRGFRFSDLSLNKKNTIKFGESRAITPGEQFARKYSGASYVSSGGKTFKYIKTINKKAPVKEVVETPFKKELSPLEQKEFSLEDFYKAAEEKITKEKINKQTENQITIKKVVSYKKTGETLSFSEEGVLGKQGRNPRGLKDTADFFRTGEALAIIKSGKNYFEQRRGLIGEKALSEAFGTYTKQQQLDIIGKIQERLGGQERLNTMLNTKEVIKKTINKKQTPEKIYYPIEYSLKTKLTRPIQYLKEKSPSQIIKMNYELIRKSPYLRTKSPSMKNLYSIKSPSPSSKIPSPSPYISPSPKSPSPYISPSPKSPSPYISPSPKSPSPYISPSPKIPSPSPKSPSPEIPLPSPIPYSFKYKNKKTEDYLKKNQKMIGTVNFSNYLADLSKKNINYNTKPKQSFTTKYNTPRYNFNYRQPIRQPSINNAPQQTIKRNVIPKQVQLQLQQQRSRVFAQKTIERGFGKVVNSTGFQKKLGTKSKWM